MKILVVCNLQNTSNPYVLTLTNQLKAIGTDLVCSLDELWSNSTHYDIVHFQWPEAVFDWAKIVSNEQVEQLHKKLAYLKSNGVKIFITCHNLAPHTCTDKGVLSLYELIYSYCDVFVHLGEYSKMVLGKDYPDAKHVIIPHHIYNTIYKFNLNKDDCQKELGIDPHKFNVLCFGEFRNDEEREFVIRLMKIGKDRSWNFITPGFYRQRLITKHLTELPSRLMRYARYCWAGIKYSTKILDDSMLEKYFTACDVVMIQRQSILNSGNLPMAFFAGKVVVGPDTGNVGDILRKTGNPVFLPRSIDSAKDSIQKAEVLFQGDKGLQNRKLAEEQWSTQVIVAQLSNLYTA